MKLTKQTLKRIIKEELEAVMNEEHKTSDKAEEALKLVNYALREFNLYTGSKASYSGDRNGYIVIDNEGQAVADIGLNGRIVIDTKNQKLAKLIQDLVNKHKPHEFGDNKGGLSYRSV